MTPVLSLSTSVASFLNLDPKMVKNIHLQLLICILSALNRINKTHKAPFSILNKANPAFKELNLTLDRVPSDLHCKGIGVDKKIAELIPLSTKAFSEINGEWATVTLRLCNELCFIQLALISY